MIQHFLIDDTIVQSFSTHVHGEFPVIYSYNYFN